MKNFWDLAAGVYDIFGYIINGRVNKEMCGYVASCIDKEDTVLECACGTGMITEAVAGKCDRMTATDYSVQMVRKTEARVRKYHNVEVETADITSLPFADESFDKVIAGNVIHLLDDPHKALKELYRVLKPQGNLIIPTYVNKKKSGKTSAFSAVVGKAGADFKREFSFDNYAAFFSEAGYTVIKEKNIDGAVPCAVVVIRKTAGHH